MREDKMTVTIDGVTYIGQLARVNKTSLTVGDPVFTAYLHASWPGGGIGVGGYSLDGPRFEDPKNRAVFLGRYGTAAGADHIIRIIETVGVDSWEKIPGHHIIVLFKDDGTGSTWGSTAVGFAAVDSNKYLIFKDHFENWDGAE